MKTRTSRMHLRASLGAVLVTALTAMAQTQRPTTTAPATPTPADVAPVKLPYGVEDILKLSRAQVTEDVILTYIRNTGTIYNLAPQDIVYLRDQGVPDRVINAMQDQRRIVPAETAAQSPAPSTTATPQAPVTSDANASAVPQYAPAYVQPAPTYVQPQPTYEPVSTLYVIPYRSTRLYYPYYYGGYYGYGGPSVVFGFGYSSGGRCGPYYGGYHGRYYGGGHYGYRGHR